MWKRHVHNPLPNCNECGTGLCLLRAAESLDICGFNFPQASEKGRTQGHIWKVVWNDRVYTWPPLLFYSLSVWRFVLFLLDEDHLAGFYLQLYLGNIVWERSPECPKVTSFLGGSGGMLPRKFFEMNMRWDSISSWSRSDNVTLSSDIFWGEAGHFGGSFYPSNTLDRTLLRYIQSNRSGHHQSVHLWRPWSTDCGVCIKLRPRIVQR